MLTRVANSLAWWIAACEKNPRFWKFWKDADFPAAPSGSDVFAGSEPTRQLPRLILPPRALQKPHEGASQLKIN